jgi:hypothetical protein
MSEGCSDLESYASKEWVEQDLDNGPMINGFLVLVDDES